MVESARLRNLVFHFKLTERESEISYKRFHTPIFQENSSIYIKSYHNFIVIKEKPLSFIFFFGSGHVNCTGTNNWSQLKRSFKRICQIFQINKLRGRQLKVSNSTWSGKLGREIEDIRSLADGSSYLPEGWTVSLRRGAFPAAILREEKGPTCIIFKNGKYNIVGALKRKKVERIESFIHFFAIRAKEEQNKSAWERFLKTRENISKNGSGHKEEG